MSISGGSMVQPDIEVESGKRSWPWRVGFYGLAVASAALIFLAPTPQLMGVAAFGLMLVLLFMKVPIAIAITGTSFLALVELYEWETAGLMFGEAAYGEVASWSLSVVPMFVLMGLALSRAGITSELFMAMKIVFNRVPASLAVGTNVAGGGLASVSGSTIGVTYALARVGLPEMLRAGYDKRLASASVLMSGLTGQLIPPSVLLVIYAGIASTPVGLQLLAGVVPGITLVILQAIALVLIGAMVPKMLGGKAQIARSREETARLPIRVKIEAVVRVWPVPFLAVLVIGGIFSGIVTETEAGALGALVALLLTMWRLRKDAFPVIRAAVVEAAATTAAVLFLLLAAGLLTTVMFESQLAQGLTNWVVDSGLGRVEFLLVMFLIYLVLGMFGETMVAMLITVPLLLPVMPELGIDPLWYGVFAVLCVELGMITPPVGVLPFVVHNIAKDPDVNLGQTFTLKDIFSGVVLLLPLTILLLALMIAFPDMVLWLPQN